MKCHAILKGLHALLARIGVFVSLKVSPWGCSDLAGDNFVPTETGILAEEIRVEREKSLRRLYEATLGRFLFQEGLLLRVQPSCRIATLGWVFLLFLLFLVGFGNGPSETLDLLIGLRFSL